MAKHSSKPPDVVTDDIVSLGTRLATLTRRVTHLEKEKVEMNQALQGLLDKLKTLEELAQHTADELHQQGGGGGGGIDPNDVAELEQSADRTTQTLNDALQGGGGQGGGQGGGDQGGGQTPPPPTPQAPPQAPQGAGRPALTPAQAAAQILARGRGRVS